MCFLILQLNKLNSEYTGHLPLHFLLMGFHLARARSYVLGEARRGTDGAAGTNFCRIFLSFLLMAGTGHTFASVARALCLATVQ